MSDPKYIPKSKGRKKIAKVKMAVIKSTFPLRLKKLEARYFKKKLLFGSRYA